MSTITQPGWPISPLEVPGMDVLSSVPWGTVTPVGALVAVLVYVLRTVSRGDWIPRSTHEEIVSHKDATISTQEETIRVQDSQLEDLSIVGETQVKILDSIYALARDRAEDDPS